MTVYFKRTRKRWCYDFSINGQRYDSYCNDPVTGKPAKTKTEAKAIETQVRSKILAGQKFDKPNSRTYTVAEAFAVYMTHVPKGRHYENQQGYVKELVLWFGPAIPLVQITHQRVLEYVAWARAEKMSYWTGGGTIRPEGPFPLGRKAADYWKKSNKSRKDSTINRYLTCLRKVLRMAHENIDAETAQPMLPIMPKIPKLKEPERLPRPISPDNLERIIEASPPHLADAIKLTVLLGFRRAEVFGLTLKHYDAHNRGIWLSFDETKGKRDEFIPASRMAVEILDRLASRARELGMDHLILYRTGGKHTQVKWRPIKNPKTAWDNTLKKLNLQGRHVFHNTKATFVTALAQEMPAAVVQDLARHKDFSTTMRYIRVADKVRRNAVESITSQIFFKPKKEEAPRTNAQIHGQDPRTNVNDGMEISANALKKLVGITGFEPATPSPPDTKIKPKPLINKKAKEPK